MDKYPESKKAYVAKIALLMAKDHGNSAIHVPVVAGWVASHLTYRSRGDKVVHMAVESGGVNGCNSYLG